MSKRKGKERGYRNLFDMLKKLVKVTFVTVAPCYCKSLQHRAPGPNSVNVSQKRHCSETSSNQPDVEPGSSLFPSTSSNQPDNQVQVHSLQLHLISLM